MVRTLFLGNIASPILSVMPLDAIKQLWGEKLPAFESLDEFNAFLYVLVDGLWNCLTKHQNSRNPFQLLRFPVSPTRESLHHFATVRRQELDGFIEGLFGPEEHIVFPEKAQQAFAMLASMRAMLADIIQSLEDLSKSAELGELKTLMRNLLKITIDAETEINKVNISCTRTHHLVE